MPRHSSYRTNHGIESVGSDWSSSQLIIGIAVAIVFGVTCFATGYVIALYDNPLPTASNTDGGDASATPPTPVPPPAPSAAPAPESKPAPEKMAAKETPASDSAPTEVASATKPAAPTPVPVPVPAPAPAPEPAKPAEPIQRSGLRPTTIDALPEPGGPTPMVRTPVDLNKAPAPKIEPMDPDASTAVPGITPPPPAGKTTAVASNVPAITPPAEKKPQAAAPATPAVVTPPPTKTAEVKPPAPKTPAVTPPESKTPTKPGKETKETKEAAATPTVTKGSFGIQVASFDGPQRSTQAKDFQRNLKTKAQMNAEIIVTADGTYHKVVITGYDSREAAKAACEKMKSKPGLEGAWPVRLP